MQAPGGARECEVYSILIFRGGVKKEERALREISIVFVISPTAMRNGLLLPVLSSLLGMSSAFMHAALARGSSPALPLRASRSAVISMALPADVEASTSWETGTYDPEDVEANWDAVVKADGSEDVMIFNDFR